MYNTLARLQHSFGFFTTVALLVTQLIILSDVVSPRDPRGIIVPDKLQVTKGRPHYYSTRREEYASIRFSLDADLSSLFTWNAKQLFVYVTAEWPETAAGDEAAGNGTTVTNVAVIWDQIITSPSADFLSNLGPASLKKLRKKSEGKNVDKERGLIKLKNQRPKYQITHPTGKIANVADVRLRLHYNVQPWVGILTWNQENDYALWSRMAGGLSEPFRLPGGLKRDE